MAHALSNRPPEALHLVKGPQAPVTRDRQGVGANRTEHLRIEADIDLGVTSRVLDMLSAVGRFPTRMRLDRDDRKGMLSLEFEIAPGAANLVARIGQIPGVRCIEPLVRART